MDFNNRRDRWENDNNNRRGRWGNELDEENGWGRDPNWEIPYEDSKEYVVIQKILSKEITGDNFNSILYDRDNEENAETTIDINGHIIYKLPIHELYATINEIHQAVPGRVGDIEYTYLYAAVLADDAKLVRLLITNFNADPNIPVNGFEIDRYPIFSCKSVETFNVLHEKGARANINNNNQQMYANNNILFYYADIYFYIIGNLENEEREDAVDYYNILKRIVELNLADINYTDKNGNTILHLYPSHGLVSLLLDDEYSSIRGEQVFNITAKNKKGENIAFKPTHDTRVIELYRNKSVDFNILNNYNRNAVFSYIDTILNEGEEIKAIKYVGVLYKLLEYGVNINQIDIFGICPLFMAGSKKMIRTLYEAKNINTIPEGNRLNMLIENEYGRNVAFYSRHAAAIKYIATVLKDDYSLSDEDVTAFFNKRDIDDSNALYYTWELSAFKEFMSRGLDIYHINKKGESIIFGFYKSIFDVEFNSDIKDVLYHLIDIAVRDNKVDDIFKKADNNGRNISHITYIQQYIIKVLNIAMYSNDNVLLNRIQNPMYRKFLSGDIFVSNIYIYMINFLLDNEIFNINATDKCNNSVFSYIYDDTSIDILYKRVTGEITVDMDGVYNDMVVGENGESSVCEFDDYPIESERVQYMYPGDSILLRRYNFETMHGIIIYNDLIITEYLELLMAKNIDINAICNYQTPRTGNTVLHLILEKLADTTISSYHNKFINDMIELKPYADLTIKNNNGKTIIDLANDYVSSQDDIISKKLKKIFSIGKKILDETYKGLCKDTLDAQMEDLFTHENEELEGEHKKKRVYFSYCPICMMPIGRTVGCVYMTHNCMDIEDNIYHKDLYNKFNRDGMIEWCTICGRITHSHYHYSLQPHDTPKEELVDHPIPAGMPTHDYWSCPGGNGLKEKVARMLVLREKFIQNSEFVGKKTNGEIYIPMIEAIFDAPLNADNLAAGQTALDENKWPEPIPELECNKARQKEKRIKPYTLPADLEMPECRGIGDNEYTYTSVKRVPLWYFKHRMANGEPHPEETLIGENVVIQHLLARDEKYGLCPYHECGALLYPEEVDVILRGRKGCDIKYIEEERKKREEEGGENEENEENEENNTNNMMSIDNKKDIAAEYDRPGHITRKKMSDDYRTFFTNQYYKLSGKEPEYVEVDEEESAGEDLATCSLPQVRAEPLNEVEPGAPVANIPNDLPDLIPVNELRAEEAAAAVAAEEPEARGGKRVRRTYKVHKKGGRKTIKGRKRSGGKTLHKIPKSAAKTLYKKTKVKNVLKSKRRKI